MSNKKSFLFILSCLLILALAVTAIAGKNQKPQSSDEQVRIVDRHASHHHNLDDEYSQLRYVKTTDYGVTWSGLTQAGDVSAIYEEVGSLPDFSSITTSSNELCCALYLAGTNPGVYSFTGPNFAPVLVAAEENNDFAVGTYAGFTDVGKTPNSDIYVVIWGLDASGHNTFWAVKSTTSGASWGTPWVLATEPALPATASYPHIADMNSATNCFVQFQDENFEQFVMHFPTTGGLGTIVDLGATAGSEVSYYIGACKPIAYDPTNNALYCCWRGNPVSTGTQVRYSGDQGATFSSFLIAGAQRYPSVALRNADQTPFVVSNFGVPGAVPSEHYNWLASDEGGYNGGLWTDQVQHQHVTYDGTRSLLYINQMYWWDANRGCSMHNVWGAFTPEGVRTSYTADGGATWPGFSQRWDFIADQMDAASTSMDELVGGTNGVAYVVFSAKIGATDLEGPGYSSLTLLSTPNLGPYTLRCYVTDAGVGVDPADQNINWYNNRVNSGEEASAVSDSAQIDNADINSGWYFFTVPDTNVNGSHISTGDTIRFYVSGSDVNANSNSSLEQYIIAGVSWQGVEERTVGQVDAFKLYANYPNPFNPETRILFDIAKDSFVTLKVYNTLGQVVSTLVNKPLASGQYAYNFNGFNLPSGIYMYKLTAGNFTATNKMVLVK